jgi:putative heme-binding domain-containing protein
MTTFVTRLREDALNALPEARRTEYQNDSPPQDNEPLTIARPEQTKWTVDSLLERLPTATTPDRHAAGAAIFREALCIRCHRFGTAGQAVGPELTYVGRRFSRQDLVSSIIEPSKVVAEPYRLTQIVTTDGLTRTGRLLMEGDYRSELIRLNTDLLQPAKQETIDKKQVETLQTVDLSPMPAGLLNGFTASEISDLLLYLETGPTPTR